MKTCNHCNKEINKDAIYCIHCGSDIDKPTNSKLSVKNIITGITAIVLYFVMMYGQAIPLELMGINVNTMDFNLKILYLTGYELLMIFLMILIFYEPLKEMFYDFLKNHKTYFKKYFKLWYLMLGLMMISNLIVSTIVGTETSANEQNIDNLFKIAPLYIYFSSVIYAPIVEELTFRLGIRKLIKHNWAFILISGLAFGFIHVMGSATLLEYLYIIPYAIPGCIFAYILVNTDNIFNTIGLHFVHNGIMMALQVILYMFM